MILFVRFLLLFVALEHFGFMALESFLWQTPFVMQLFHQTAEQAAASAVLAANQGVYNGLFAVGLLFGFARRDKTICRLFLTLILAAGVFGAFTADPKILFVQAMPAALALLATFCPRSSQAFRPAK